MKNINLIISDYRNGKSLTKIAKDENVSRRQITKLLKESGEIIINRHNELKFDQHYFDKIDTEEKAYWLGFIFADGCIMKNSYSFELSLCKKDKKHVENFAKSIKFTGKLYDKQNSIACCLRSKHLWMTLNKLGCIPNKSLSLEFPNIEHFSDKILLKHFIRGYFDGDGCISQHKHIHIVSPNISLIGTRSFLNEVINVTGINAKFIHNKRNSANTFSLQFSKQSGIDFINYIYSDSNIHLSRKYDKFIFFQNGSRSIQEWIEFYQPKSVKACDGNTEVNIESKESISPYSVEIETII